MDPFARVLAEPGSLAARRALLAAWHAAGDPRAQLIEQQLDYRERVLAGDANTDELLRAINVAIGRNGKAWAGELAGLVKKFVFRRGLVAEITITGVDFVARAARLFELAPIQHLTLAAPLPPVAELFAVPALARLSTLNVPGVGAAFGDAGARALAACPHAGGLRWISVVNDDIGAAGVEALAASPVLAHARYVGLRGNHVDPTPFVREVSEGSYVGGRPPLAEQLERAYGARPWLAIPSDPEAWPPDHEALAITP